ncbi:MAG TPA: ABC transporter permease [Sandaracinaceae bacterium LLY-WYZ-13_1]|nr:ABC transporter permease [Sandaracinaceae bacterium LLY-WYZ-13_1]
MLAALLVSVPALAVLVALGVALWMHPYAGRVGWRYLRSKKRRTVSVITFIAVAGVALGVAALLAVMSITSGFQDEFRNKVLGVNAHVLVLKYGLDFEEYRDVVGRAREMPEVAGAAPFLINEMMLSKGDRISGVLVKGIDPELMSDVLDLPSQMQQGTLAGLRAPGAAPPTSPDALLGPVDDDWSWLNRLAEADGGLPPLEAPDGGAGADAGVPALPTVDVPSPDDVNAAMEDAALPGDEPALPGEIPGDAFAEDGDDGFEGADGPVDLPDVDVPSPEEAEEALGSIEEPELPPDDLLDQYFEEEELLLDPASEEEQRELAELPGIVVGTTLARNLGLGVGDRVSVISPLAGLDTSMFGEDRSAPRSRDFRVIGIFEAGFQEYDSRLVYVDLYEAQHFFDHGDSVTGVELRLHDLEDAPEIARRLERVLGGGPYHTMDWQELNHNLFTALVIQKIALTLVTSCIILVAAFVVIATLIMVVLEKKREIAILKAMGARSFGVLLVFIVQGLVIGLIGTAIGLVLGGGVCWYLEAIEYPLDPHVYLIDHVPVRTSPSEFIMTVAITLLICIGATIIPSWWAARLLPADGVRYE